MIFSYNWLKDYIKGKLPAPEKLAELLIFHSFEVESVAKKGKDWILDIDVLPNRAPDCLSHIGIAREIAVITGGKLQIPKFELREAQNLKTKDFLKVEVRNKNDCPRYTAKVISGVKVASSPKWIKARLKACGLQPINNIVDITNYVMLETGQPVHAFDLEKIEADKRGYQRGLARKIIVRRAKKGEKIKALDDKIYQLDKDILVIADQKKPIAVAGIKGGEGTAIDSKTKNIVIEAANFNQRVTRGASKKLKLKTDASWRFENGISPDLIDFAQERVSFLIQKFAGGLQPTHRPPAEGGPLIAQGLIDFYPQKESDKKIKLDLNYLEKLLGISMPKEKIIKILKSLEFQLSEVGPRQIMVTVPRRRLDISIQQDLIEEVGRITGFQKIPSLFPQAALIPPERNDEIFWERLSKDILKESRFSEVYNYSFIGEKEKEIFDFKEKELLELQNPMSSFNKYLRPSLIPNLLKNIKENFKWFDKLKIFEIGKIFQKNQKPKPKTQKVKEKKMLSGVLTGKDLGDEGFYELKGIVDSLFNKLGISDIWYDDVKATPEESKLNLWHPKKSAEIKTNGEEIGFLGEIHPKILEDLKIKEKVFVFDLDFEKLYRLASEEHEYRPISAYPAAVRDLALLVPRGTKVVEVLNKINEAGGTLVRDVDLFDIYTGEEIAEGKENFAFHIIYQAEDRTLSSKEIDKIHQKIIKALEENPEWEVRR